MLCHSYATHQPLKSISKSFSPYFSSFSEEMVYFKVFGSVFSLTCLRKVIIWSKKNEVLLYYTKIFSYGLLQEEGRLVNTEISCK